MTIPETNIAKQAVHDQIASLFNSADSALSNVKARAEKAKATAEIKAIVELAPKRALIEQRLKELKTTSADKWEQAKRDLESRVSEFDKSVKSLEARVKKS
jgi:hypothetical protein